MSADWLYRVPVLQHPKPASRVGGWPQSPTLFIPVTWGTLLFLYGTTALVIDPYFLTGTEEEVQQALNTLREQISEEPFTLEELLTLYEFRVVRHSDGVLHLEARPEGEP